MRESRPDAPRAVSRMRTALPGGGDAALRTSVLDRYRMLQVGLLTLRAGPALILLILIVVV
jgi:hypothetical protein